MKPPLRLLLLEDDPVDADLITATMTEGGIPCQTRRVDTRQDFIAALKEGQTDLILADYSIPRAGFFAARFLAAFFRAGFFAAFFFRRGLAFFLAAGRAAGLAAGAAGRETAGAAAGVGAGAGGGVGVGSLDIGNGSIHPEPDQPISSECSTAINASSIAGAARDPPRSGLQARRREIERRGYRVI